MWMKIKLLHNACVVMDCTEPLLIINDSLCLSTSTSRWTVNASGVWHSAVGHVCVWVIANGMDFSWACKKKWWASCRHRTVAGLCGHGVTQDLFCFSPGSLIMQKCSLPSHLLDEQQQLTWKWLKPVSKLIKAFLEGILSFIMSLWKIVLALQK